MFTPANRQVKPVGPDNNGGMTAPAYLEQRQDSNNDGTTEPTLPAPGQGMTAQQGQKTPEQPQFTPKDGNTPMPQQSPLPNPVASPLTQQAGAVPPPPAQQPAPPQLPAFTPQTSVSMPRQQLAPQVQEAAPQQAPDAQPAPQAFTPAPPAPAVAPAAPQSAQGQIFSADPSRPGAGYVMFNGKQYRVEGTTAAGLDAKGNPNSMNGASYLLDDGNGNAIVGPQVDQNAYNSWVNGAHAPDADPTHGSMPGNTTARAMINGEVVTPQGELAPAALQQQRTIGGITTPYRNPDANPGAMKADPATLQALAANPFTPSAPSGAQTAVQTNPNGGAVGAPPPTGSPAPGNSFTPAGGNGGAQGVAPSNPAGGVSTTAPASGSSNSAAGIDNFGGLGQMILGLLNQPSAYDDKTMQDAIANNEAKLKTSEDQGLAGVDADTAARGLLMGSPNVIDRSKIRNQIQQARGDFDTNITLDRAHTMAQDRSQAFNNAFGFINAGQNQQQIDNGQNFNWAQLAAELGSLGAPNSNSAMGGMPMPQPNFGGIDPQTLAAIGALFAKQGSPAGSNGSGNAGSGTYGNTEQGYY